MLGLLLAGGAVLLGQQTADRETDRKPGKKGQVKVEYKWLLPGRN